MKKVFFFLRIKMYINNFYINYSFYKFIFSTHTFILKEFYLIVKLNINHLYRVHIIIFYYIIYFLLLFLFLPKILDFIFFF